MAHAYGADLFVGFCSTLEFEKDDSELNCTSRHCQTPLSFSIKAQNSTAFAFFSSHPNHPSASATLPTLPKMQAILRESLFGQTVNHLSKGRYFPYPEDQPDFQVPAHFLVASTSSSSSPKEKHSRQLSPESTLSTRAPTPLPPAHRADSDNQTLSDAHAQEIVQGTAHKVGLEDGKDPNLVSWYSDDDPENPQ